MSPTIGMQAAGIEPVETRIGIIALPLARIIKIEGADMRRNS